MRAHQGSEAFTLLLALVLTSGVGGGQGKQSPHLAEEEAEPQGGPMSKTGRVAKPDCTQLYIPPPGPPCLPGLFIRVGRPLPPLHLAGCQVSVYPRRYHQAFSFGGGWKAVWKPCFSHLCSCQCLAQSLAHRVASERPQLEFSRS